MTTRKMGPWTMVFGTRDEVTAEYWRIVNAGRNIDAPKRAGGPVSENVWYIRFLTEAA